MKYGIIGSGMMGQEHMRNIALVPGTQITAIADTDAQMRDQAQALAPSATAFADFRDLIAADLCDAYVVATPNFHHHEVMRDLIPARKPILCEKPLCTTLPHCRELLDLAQRHDTPVWVAMEYRYMPAMDRLLSELRKGAAGPARTIAIREHRFPFLEKVADWNRFAQNTGGTLVEKCCHFFDLMRLALGQEPMRVFASGAMDVNFLDEKYDGQTPDILDNAYAIVDFDGGARGMLDLCMFAEGTRWQEVVTVTGDIGQVEARLPGPARFAPPGRSDHSEISIYPRSGTPLTEEVPLPPHLSEAGEHNGSTYFQHLRFNEFARKGGAPDVSLTDGLRAVEIGLAAEASIKTGMVVAL